MQEDLRSAAPGAPVEDLSSEAAPGAGASQTRERARLLRAQLARYGRVISWVFRDALIRFRRDTLTAAMLGYLGLLAQGIALGVMVTYARAIEKGTDFNFLGRTADPRVEMWMLFTVAGVIIVLLAISAGFIYLSRLRAYDLVREYEEFCTKRIFSLLARLPSPRSPLASLNLTDRKTYQLLRDARYSARILILLIFSFQAAVTVVIAYVGLLFINAPLSLLITGLIVLSLVFLYRVSIWGARHSIRMEKHSPGAAAEKRQILTDLKRAPAPSATVGNQVETMLASGTMKNFLDAYIGRLRQPESSKLVTNLLTAAALFSILVIEGSALLKGQDNWSTLVVYLVALRYFLNNLSVVANTYTKLNRFFPLLRTHHEFIKDASAAGEDPPVVTVDYELRPPGPALDELPIPTLKRGSVVGLMLPGPLTRFSLAPLIGSLGVDPAASRELVLSSYRLCLTPGGAASPPLSLRHAFGFDASRDDAALSADLVALLGSEKVPLLDTSASDKALESLSDEGRSVMAVLAGIHSDAEILVVEAWELAAVSPQVLEALRARLSSKVLVVAHRAPGRLTGRFDEVGHIISTETKVLGWAHTHWIVENPERLEELLARETGAAAASAQVDELLLDEDEV